MARSVLLAVVALAVVASVVPMLDPKVSDALVARFSSVTDISHDGSAVARAELYREAPGLIDEAPLGLGIGAIGRGAVAANNNTLVNVDAGVLVVYLALGWLPGTIYMAGMLLIVGQALLAARASRSPVALMLAITALGGITTFMFTALVGLQGVIIWLCAGYASAIAGSAPRPLPAGAPVGLSNA